jgi:hypothetical protein
MGTDRRGFGSLVLSMRGGADPEGADIWLLAGEEPPRRLAEGWAPALSPDGCSLFAVQRGPDGRGIGGQVVLDVATSSARLALSSDDLGEARAYAADWSPDSGRLALTLGSPTEWQAADDLWLLDAAQGDLMRLAQSGAGTPTFSPDGRWIATSTRVIEWSVRHWESLGLWSAEDGRGGPLFDQLYEHAFAWAADSSGLAIAVDTDGEPGYELWWVPVDGILVQLGALPNAESVIWGPGAERVAWSVPGPRTDSVTSGRTLYLAQRDGSGAVAVPGSEEMLLAGDWWEDLPDAWSPNGRWLLVRDGGNNVQNTYIVDTKRLGEPILLGMSPIHGWLDAGHYLASYGYEYFGERRTDLYLCRPPATCQFLAQVDGDLRRWAYTPNVCAP